MTRAELIRQIQIKKSFLCVGLDTDLTKIPQHFLLYDDPIFEFNKAIIDATADFAVAYKPNIAFYEALGPSGWESLRKTINYLPKEVFAIADAKRGDIGNTANQYAQAFFKTLHFDSITVAPYMGEDSVKPFLAYEGKWAIVLGLTSNPGSADFQRFSNGEENLFEHVLRKTAEWGTPDNLMFVVGATHPDDFKKIRAIVPDHFLLVPGVGAQGGSLEDVCTFGLNKDCGLLVNSSRAILYASSGKDFAMAAREEARRMQEQMEVILRRI